MSGEYEALLKHIQSYNFEHFIKENETEFCRVFLKRIGSLLKNVTERDKLFNNPEARRQVLLFINMDALWEGNENLFMECNQEVLEFLSFCATKKSSVSRYAAWMKEESEKVAFEDEAFETNKDDYLVEFKKKLTPLTIVDVEPRENIPENSQSFFAESPQPKMLVDFIEQPTCKYYLGRRDLALQKGQESFFRASQVNAARNYTQETWYLILAKSSYQIALSENEAFLQYLSDHLGNCNEDALRATIINVIHETALHTNSITRCLEEIQQRYSIAIKMMEQQKPEKPKPRSVPPGFEHIEPRALAPGRPLLLGDVRVSTASTVVVPEQIIPAPMVQGQMAPISMAAAQMIPLQMAPTQRVPASVIYQFKALRAAVPMHSNSADARMGVMELRSR